MPRKKKEKTTVVETNKRPKPALTPDQLEAVRKSKTNFLSLVYGGPGTGKTTIIDFIADENTLLLSPTGTAASVISRKTGRMAYTIHNVLSSAKLLKSVKKKRVVIDEGSMVSVELFTKILLHVNPASIVLVGDKRQLDTFRGFSILTTLLFLGDMVPRTELNVDFRTKDGSYLQKTIVSLAKTGKKLPTPPPPGDDSFRTIKFPTEQMAKDWVVKQFSENVQILAHTKKTVKELNYRTASKEKDGEQRVVCLRNLYISSKLTVTNGTMGVLKKDEKGNDIIEYENNFTDRKRMGRFSTLYQPARVLTGHKAQGSQFEREGILFLTDADANLPLSYVYTGISRFEKKVTVVSTTNTITKIFNEDHAGPLTEQEIDARFGNKHDNFFVECFKEEITRLQSDAPDFIC